MSDIKGFLETSFVDWHGRVCAVIFLSGCNFRCPFCHNHTLVLAPETLESFSFEEILQRLRHLKKWLGGICISGGEPTLHPDLAMMLKRIKEEGWAVKIDTNGTRPRLLEKLLNNGLVDMVSMDVKAPLEEKKYNRCAGGAVNLKQIKASISILQNSGVRHEFRMTVLPRFHTKADVVKWAKDLGGNGGKGISRLKLQNFNPQSTMDPTLSAEKSFTPEKFKDLQEIVA